MDGLPSTTCIKEYKPIKLVRWLTSCRIVKIDETWLVAESKTGAGYLGDN